MSTGFNPRAHAGRDATRLDDGRAVIEVKNRFAVGDRLELLLPAGNRTLTLAALADTEGRPVEVAPGNGHRVLADLGAGVDGALISRLF